FQLLRRSFRGGRFRSGVSARDIRNNASTEHSILTTEARRTQRAASVPSVSLWLLRFGAGIRQCFPLRRCEDLHDFRHCCFVDVGKFRRVWVTLRFAAQLGTLLSIFTVEALELLFLIRSERSPCLLHRDLQRA